MAGRRWLQTLATRTPEPPPRVFYGRIDLPRIDEPASGPLLKLQQLAERFPNSSTSFNLLYLGSSGLPRDVSYLVRFAKRRGIPIVLNQNGVAYPAWAGVAWERLNQPLRLALAAADHVLYQSAFCKADADRYLGAAPASSEILHNAVDVNRFRPSDERPDGLVLLAGGDQRSPRRLELALRTLAVVLQRHPGARLVVPGRLRDDGDALLAASGVGEHVDVVGRYAHADAPALYRGATVLLHTKVNDPCPNVVLEALASGLPVVYPASGGVGELVGDAGIAVTHEESHEVLLQPSPDAMADGVDAALGMHQELAAAARRRAETLFPLEPWLERHQELFAELVGRRPST